MPLLRHLRVVLTLAARADDCPHSLQHPACVDGEPSGDGAHQEQQQHRREEQLPAQPQTAMPPVSDTAAGQQAAAAAAGGAPEQNPQSAAALRAAVEAVAEEVAAEAGGPDERLQAMQAAQDLIEQYMQFADRIHDGECNQQGRGRS